MSTEEITSPATLIPQIGNQIQAFVEPLPTGGFRIHSGTLGITLEAPTREAAITRLQLLIEDRLRNGGQLLSFASPNDPKPWMRFAGDLKDDPMLEEWKQIIAKNRAERDREELGR